MECLKQSFIIDCNQLCCWPSPYCNEQDALDASFNVNEAEEKENSSAIRVAKRKKQPVLAGVDVGMLLYSAMR
jgi:hypothetical protein